MDTHNQRINYIPAIEARATLNAPTPSEFRQDGPFGVWAGVALVFVITAVVLAVGAFAIFLIGVIYTK